MVSLFQLSWSADSGLFRFSINYETMKSLTNFEQFLAKG